MAIHLLLNSKSIVANTFLVRFQREFRAPNSMPKKQNEGVNSKSFANVLKSNTTKSSVSATVADFKPVIVLDDSCILEKDLSCAAIGKIKDINDLSNLYVILNNEGFDNSFGCVVRGLDVPGELYERKTYPFEFSTVEMPYETYSGANVRLRGVDSN
nr:vacuolar protein sorting-associated protein 26B [Tanacetum cinerariifolium]